VAVLGQNRGRVGGWCDVDSNELVLTFRGCYLCATFGKNRSINATRRVQTDRRTQIETKGICNLSRAICCRYGADNNNKIVMTADVKYSMW